MCRQSRGLQSSKDVPLCQMPPRVGCPLKQAPVTPVPEPRPSVATLWTMILVKLHWIASAACRNILVSASSCQDGARLEVSSHGRLVSMPLAYVEVISLWPEVTEVLHCVRNLKSSCLFPSSQRNSFQFLGSLLLAATSCPTPDPCFQVVAFKLFSTLFVPAEQWHKALTYLRHIRKRFSLYLYA